MNVCKEGKACSQTPPLILGAIAPWARAPKIREDPWELAFPNIKHCKVFFCLNDEKSTMQMTNGEAHSYKTKQTTFLHR